MEILRFSVVQFLLHNPGPHTLTEIYTGCRAGRDEVFELISVLERDGLLQFGTRGGPAQDGTPGPSSTYRITDRCPCCQRALRVGSEVEA